MAHKKGAASTKNGRDSNSKRLGVKRYGGQLVNAGEIIVKAPPGTWFLDYSHEEGEAVFGRDPTKLATACCNASTFGSA